MLGDLLQTYEEYLSVRAGSFLDTLKDVHSLPTIASCKQALEIMTRTSDLLSAGLEMSYATELVHAPPLQVRGQLSIHIQICIDSLLLTCV